MTIKDLHNDPSFTLLLMLPHDEIMPFVENQIKSKTATIRTYFGLNILLAAIIILIATLDIWKDRASLWEVLEYFGLGSLLVFVVLIPVHEGLHGLAYKLTGAPKISFGANWRMFYFYAVADQFVADKKSFIFIALLPFAVISILIIPSLFFVALTMKWILLGVLFMHTAACVGDFAMLSFYEQNRQAKELLTYDDVSQKRSFFYVRE